MSLQDMFATTLLDIIQNLLVDADMQKKKGHANSKHSLLPLTDVRVGKLRSRLQP